MTPPAPADLSSLITAVLPTHNRAAVLSRAIRYYQDVPFNIIVVDSSAERHTGLMPSRFDYRHVPGQPYTRKVAAAFREVRTPFCILLNDDDFFILDALRQEVAFLQEHPDYASVQGYWLWMYWAHKVLAPAYDKRLGFRIDADDAGGRLLQIKSNYMHICYAVMRTSAMQPMMEHIQHFDNIYAVEFLLTFGAAILGKHQMLPILHCVRDQQEVSAGRDPVGYAGMAQIPHRSREHAYGYYALTCLARDTMGLGYEAAFDIVDRITSPSLVARTIEERRAPPFRAPPPGVEPLDAAAWTARVTPKSNPSLLGLQARLLEAIADWETPSPRAPSFLDWRP